QDGGHDEDGQRQELMQATDGAVGGVPEPQQPGNGERQAGRLSQEDAAPIPHPVGGEDGGAEHQEAGAGPQQGPAEEPTRDRHAGRHRRAASPASTSSTPRRRCVSWKYRLTKRTLAKASPSSMSTSGIAAPRRSHRQPTTQTSNAAPISSNAKGNASRAPWITPADRRIADRPNPLIG